MLIHENDVSELWVETKFGVCVPRSFVNTAYVAMKEALKISYIARKFVDFVHGWKQTRS